MQRAIFAAATSSLLIVFWFLADTGKAARFQILDLDSFTSLTDVSADGSVIVGSHGYSFYQAIPFRWTEAGGMEDLGDLPGGASDASKPLGISADGSIIVGESNSGAGGSLGMEAFRWTPATGMVGLGGDSGIDFYSRVATGISADGSVIVGYGEIMPGLNSVAFRWTQSGGFEYLNPLSFAESHSKAKGISADGSVVVGESWNSADARFEAVRWRGATPVSLGVLPGDVNASTAASVSADGSVIVGHLEGEWGGVWGYEAFRWTESGGMIALGDLPGGSINTFATDVCSDGTIIVGYGSGAEASSGYAFVWDELRGMQSFQHLLKSEFGLAVPEDYVLGTARAISADGQTIVGDPSNVIGHGWIAYLDGVTRSWTGAATGDWDQPGNWTAWGKPGPQTTVVISPDSSATVAGPARIASVDSLTIGARTSGTATLTLAGESLSVTNGTIINSRGQLDHRSGTLSAAWIDNAGMFRQSLGAWVNTASFQNEGMVELNGTLMAYNAIENLGTMTIAPDATVLAQGTGLKNLGTFELEGGVIAGQGVTNEASGQMTARGTINTWFANLGVLELSGTLTVNDASTNTGQITIGPARSYRSSGAFTNNGVIEGTGGSIAPIGSGSFVNAAGGELRVGAGKTLSLTRGFTSSGLIALGGTGARLAAGGQITNSGTIRGAGRIDAALVSTGRIETFDTVVGLEFGQQLTNSGLVAVHNATLRLNAGMNSSGQLSFGAGDAAVFGDIDNTGIIGLASTATVNFVGNLHQNGTLNLLGDSRATVFGNFSGTGGAAGNGTLEVLGMLSPGSSTASVSFAGNVELGGGAHIELGGTQTGAYDRIAVGNHLALGGMLHVDLYDGFVPQAGHAFEILDWGTRTGTFSSLVLPTLAGLTWDTSQLYTTGVLSVAAPGLPGDFNNDGTVDAADYVVWRKDLGATYTQNDYNTWRANYGATAGSGTTIASNPAAVPEPSTFIITLWVASLLLMVKRTSHRF